MANIVGSVVSFRTLFLNFINLNCYFPDEQALNSSTEQEGEASGEASGEGSGLGGNMTAETHAEDSDDSL